MIIKKRPYRTNKEMDMRGIKIGWSEVDITPERGVKIGLDGQFYDRITD